MVTLPALYRKAILYSLASLVALLASTYTLHSQNVRVEVPPTVIQGTPFQLVYTIQGEAEIERFDNPKLNGLKVLYGPARQTMSSFHSVNGRSTSSSSTSLTYTLLAEQAGNYKGPMYVSSPERGELQSHPPRVADATYTELSLV